MPDAVLKKLQEMEEKLDALTAHVLLALNASAPWNSQKALRTSTSLASSGLQLPVGRRPGPSSAFSPRQFQAEWNFPTPPSPPLSPVAPGGCRAAPEFQLVSPPDLLRSGTAFSSSGPSVSLVDGPKLLVQTVDGLKIPVQTASQSKDAFHSEAAEIPEEVWHAIGRTSKASATASNCFGGSETSRHSSNWLSVASLPRIGAPKLRSLQTIEVGQVLADDARFQKMLQRPPIFDFIWLFLTDAESGRAAWVFSRALNPFFLFAVFLTISQQSSPPIVPSFPAAILETSLEVFFFLEFALRVIVCPNHCAFIHDPFNALDFASVAPLALRASIGFTLPEVSEEESVGTQWLITRTVLLGVVPVVRLLKCLRRFESFHLILTAFGVAYEALPVMLYIWFVIALSSSTAVYFVEPRTNIASMPDALWFSLTTMTTVGYGDVFPITSTGKLIVSVLMIVSTLYMAIPIGIVGNAFNNVWIDRHRLLLLKRTRDRLVALGYGAADIPRLFELIGRKRKGADGQLEGSNQLYFVEFRRLLQEMRVPMCEENVKELFKSLDVTDDGTIDADEFTRGLFPASYGQAVDTDRTRKSSSGWGLGSAPVGEDLLEGRQRRNANPECGAGEEL